MLAPLGVKQDQPVGEDYTDRKVLNLPDRV